MNLDLVGKIANAVLYEGYMLYPYRPSAVKNQQRFNFGVVVPPAYSEAQKGAEICRMQTECLVLGGQSATVEARARFLHLIAREVGEFVMTARERRPGEGKPDGANLDEPRPDLGRRGSWRARDWREDRDWHADEDSKFRPVRTLELDGRVYQSWQEAVERELTAPRHYLGELIARPQRHAFTFLPMRESEPLLDAGGRVAGMTMRSQEPIEGAIEISAEQLDESLFRLTTRLLNLTPARDAGRKSRDEALMQSLVSAHVILGLRDGEFISQFDPPDEFREASAGCHNEGTWPVLVGEEGERDMMLSSPIILYDYPQIAPESACDLFDGTEIDEILMLRILTLTEEEKREMRNTDERARQILERTETLPPEQLMKLHGALRGLRPSDERGR
jgi:hydrogenase maturation protease